MKKIIALLTIIALSLGSFVGCGASNEGVSKESKDLVIYSPNSEEIVSTIIPMFEKETGIKVEIVTAGTGELIKRIQSEKNKPYADVLFGGSKSEYLSKLDLFEKYVSADDKELIDGHRNDTGYMTPYVSDGNVLLVNTQLLGNIKIEGYDDLLNPALKGKIASADPANSSSAFGQLNNMLLAIGGDYTSDKGWNYVGKLIKNMSGKVQSSSGVVHKSVADAEYVVALTYESPCLNYLKNGAPVKIVYPKEGVVFTDSCTGIIKGSKNMDNAKKFVDFIISKEAQDTFGDKISSRPLRKGSTLASYKTPIDKIKTLKEDEKYIKEHKKDIVEKYKQLFTSSQK